MSVPSTTRFLFQSTLLAVILLLTACQAASPTTAVEPVALVQTTAAPATAVPAASTPTTAALTETATPTLPPAPTSTRRPTRTPLPSPTATLTRTPWPAEASGLRDLAVKHNLFIGSAVQADLLENEAGYRQVAQKEFNIVTPEWEMKMCAIWPERDHWDFTKSDAIVQFALDNGMRVRGHTLVWTECIPDWVNKGSFTAEEASQILHEYISTVVGRYQGKIAYWDVLNETVERRPIWEELIGPDYAKLAFQWAHEADPQALLFYNDFNAEIINNKSDKVYAFVKGLKEEGVPIDGVGLQMHLKGLIPPNSVARNIDRLNALGLQVHITELDIPKVAGVLNPDETQADVYRSMLQVCMQASNCPVFIMWGFTDKHTWLSTNLDQPDASPLIFDAEYRPKPAYEALYNTLQTP